MKPTQKCKINYIAANYYDANYIPSMDTVRSIFNIDDSSWPMRWIKTDEYFDMFLKDDNKCEIIDYMLAKTPAWTCSNCIHKHEYKLTGKCGAAYEPN